jgi:hypothetical protein
MNEHVREPIQTYLTAAERAALDQVAARLGVSRSEVLRRGIGAVGGADAGEYAGALRKLVADGSVTAPLAAPGRPPPSRPVAPLEEVLAELESDRAGR